jgi:transposase
LSLEQQRRRRQGNLPHEHYDLAVLRHAWIDPETDEEFSGRVLFIFSTADEKICQAQRAKQIAKIRDGLTALARSVAEGRRNTDQKSLPIRVAKVLGKHAAAKYFRWELVPLTKAERAAWTSPSRGCTRPTLRLEFTLDQAAVDRDAHDDGYAALVTTVPQSQTSADELFTKYKQQIFCEHAHHVFKGPLAVMPVFLKRPERVEALLFLMMIALQAYFVLQRRYRQSLPEDATAKQQRTTAKTLLKSFSNYSMLLEQNPVGTLVHPGRLNVTQRQILQQLNLPSPAQTLRQSLPRAPT